MLSDCHTHLDSWGEEDRRQIVAAAVQAGVELVLASAMTVESSKEAIAIAATYPQVFACVGIHPWNPEPWSQDLYRSLKELARNPGVVALSEVGLDWNRGDRELQRELLRGEIALALELGLPLILHCRGAHDEVMTLLRAAPGVTGAAHGFSGTPAELHDWLELGFYVSAGRGLLRGEAPSWEAVVREIPEDRLLLETDANNGPSVAGEAPGPAGVAAVARRVAGLRGSRVEVVGEVATANLKRLLKLGA